MLLRPAGQKELNTHMDRVVSAKRKTALLLVVQIIQVAAGVTVFVADKFGERDKAEVTFMIFLVSSGVAFATNLAIRSELIWAIIAKKKQR